jgi:hypothetical protein
LKNGAGNMRASAASLAPRFLLGDPPSRTPVRFVLLLQP